MFGSASSSSRAGDLPLVDTLDALEGPRLVDRARLLLEALPNIVILSDSSGRLIYLSVEARLLDVGEADRVVGTAKRLTPTLASKLSIRRYMGGEYGAYARSRGLDSTDRVLVVRYDVGKELRPLQSVIVATPTRSSDRPEM